MSFDLMKCNIVNDVIIISSSFLFFFLSRGFFFQKVSQSWYTYIKKHRGYSKIQINRQNFPSWGIEMSNKGKRKAFSEKE